MTLFRTRISGKYILTTNGHPTGRSNKNDAVACCFSSATASFFLGHLVHKSLKYLCQVDYVHLEADLGYI